MDMVNVFKYIYHGNEWLKHVTKSEVKTMNEWWREEMEENEWFAVR